MKKFFIFFFDMISYLILKFSTFLWCFFFSLCSFFFKVKSKKLCWNQSSKLLIKTSFLINTEKYDTNDGNQ